MNIEGAYIYKDIIEKKDITYKSRDLAKLFSATMPYSLESMRIANFFPNTFYEIKNKQYTREIINVTFDKHYSVWNENVKWQTRSGENKKGKRSIIAKKNKIRKYLYNNGFTMDGKKYVFYKRGAGKAKNGYALFIREDMDKPLINRSRLGLEFAEDEILDLTSLKAYESLISSGINFTINLDPHTEILLIDDIYGKEFDSLASVTYEENGEVKTDNQNIVIKNCLSDGQNLMDESVFEKYEESDKGFMLLRSDMYKGCAFNTKLQAWFEANNITILKDMFGKEYDATKIKLITTPNSLKFLKFAYKFTKTETIQEYNQLNDNDKVIIQQKCYEHWRYHIDDIFGVVKCDSEGNYGSYNRTTYQMLNSMPNLNYEDLLEITKVERDYVMSLKNDDAVFRHYLGCDAKRSLEFEKDLENKKLNLYENTDLMSALLLINSDFQYTKRFKKFKSDLIANYIDHLKKGRVRMKGNKYVTIVSNPYEMLLASIGIYEGESIMTGREVYCPHYKDNKEFCVIRNPQINSGNIMHTNNVFHQEYEDWFNFTDNICCINFYDDDAPDRLQGCDTDSDTILLMPNALLAEKSKYCEEKFPTPINKVKGDSKPKKNNMNELYKLDVVLSNNYIGKIVNMSQIINSYMNHAIFQGSSDEVIDELYQASSRLSSMSQIEIDKSKKVFENVSMSTELSKIRKIKTIRYMEGYDKFGEIVDKMVVPEFFQMISDSNDYRVFEKFNTPMDILQIVLDFKGGKRRKGHKNIDLKELLINPSGLEGRYQKKSIVAIYDVIEDCGKKINGLKLKTCSLNESGKATVARNAKMDAIEKLKNIKTPEKNIFYVVAKTMNKEDSLKFSKYAMLTMNLLFMSKRDEFVQCFHSKDMSNDKLLIKSQCSPDIDIFGDSFKKIGRNDIDLY